MITGGADDGKFKETELRLGLPGGGGSEGDVEVMVKSGGKRGFSETVVDLKLNLSSVEETSSADNVNNTNNVIIAKEIAEPTKPPAAKAQVMGWPPIRSFRKNILATQKSSTEAGDIMITGAGAALVKVSMDGAPFLRKVDLNMHKSYQDLSAALAKMFSSFTIGKIDIMNESKLMDLLNGSDYVPTYEDKDGDWMLVGDVPWEMFVESCKRLRIMTRKEAVGLAPRAMERCKNKT